MLQVGTYRGIDPGATTIIEPHPYFHAWAASLSVGFRRDVIHGLPGRVRGFATIHSMDPRVLDVAEWDPDHTVLLSHRPGSVSFIVPVVPMEEWVARDWDGMAATASWPWLREWVARLGFGAE